MPSMSVPSVVAVDESTITKDASGVLSVKDAGIVAGKIGSGAVTAAKIGSGAVTAAKLAAALVSGQRFVKGSQGPSAGDVAVLTAAAGTRLVGVQFAAVNSTSNGRPLKLEVTYGDDTTETVSSDVGDQGWMGSLAGFARHDSSGAFTESLFALDGKTVKKVRIHRDSQLFDTITGWIMATEVPA